MNNWCRIYGIMARKGPFCVLFRRGPTDWTQLIRWNTQNDEMQFGHWFNGRVYEHRCDVSPNGEWLLYFVNRINERTLEDTEGYTYAWSAVSRPPFFKAEVLWPKGNCWHGGGLFHSDREIFLNHRPDVAVPHPNHVSSRFKVEANSHASGEDEPIHSMRISRDGWKCNQVGQFLYAGLSKGWETRQTEIWEKDGRDGKKLRREHLGINFQVYGGPYVEEYSFISKSGTKIAISNADWAELDQKGKLVYSRYGKICRGYLKRGVIEETVLADLNENQPPRRKRNHNPSPERTR